MHIAILTFDGYNELDSLIALGILNRVRQPGWRVSIAAPSAQVTSMNGVVIHAPRVRSAMSHRSARRMNTSRALRNSAPYIPHEAVPA